MSRQRQNKVLTFNKKKIKRKNVCFGLVVNQKSSASNLPYCPYTKRLLQFEIMKNKKSAIKDYNIELRSYVLNLALSIEDLSTQITKSLLRKVKPDSKTLDNKSSSLSLKNKIDMLYDIGDFDKKTYTKVLKFMEIRNQFIHNPECNNFTDLESVSPDLTKYLKKEFSNEIKNQEDSYVESFKKLHLHAFSELLILLGEYKDGEQEEVNRYMNSLVINDIGSILENTKKIWLERKTKNSSDNESLESEFTLFYNSFKDAFDRKVSELTDKNEADFPKGEIYSRKKNLIKKNSS